MYFATERRSREIVPAHKANPWRDYFCPTCKAGVFLRSGKQRDKHFAHMPRQGKPECEDFHPSNDLARSWQNNIVATPEPSVDPLKLGIELEPDRVAGRGPRNWRLCLTVPKSHDVHGKISIDLGGGDVRPLTLAKLSLGAQTYVVDLTAPEFGAKWVSPEVHAKYKSAVEERVAGLDNSAINAFSSTRQKTKPLTDAFCWGESYYFVWRSDASFTFPPGLISHSLAENCGWCCALGALPHAPEEELADWLTTNCNLPIIRAKRDWAIVYPPPFGFDDNGSLEIPVTTEVVLALKSIGSEQPGDLSCTVGSASVSLALAEAVQHFAELSDPKSAANKPVHLAWDGTHLITLVAKPHPDSPIEPSVVLEFEQGGTRESISLHHARARHLLSDTREAKVRLTAIHVHSALHGELRQRKSGTLNWASEPLIAAPVVSARVRRAPISPELIERINEILHDTSLDIALDFGPFGSFFARGADKAEIPAVAFRVQRQLRARIEWLCKASGAFVSRDRKPVGLLDDQALIHHFSRLVVPAELLAHKRALESLVRYSSRYETAR
ncbi:hypothetical protein ACVIHI_007963 [Bradyrhizobium sp. USDA 4524]|uniref:competence protein CoiA family protein n=1 Tax=unclassified Bradyrhizobium TaxID=2631580 RepID=UPI0020A0B838|nr:MULTISPECIES: competence protein CoiA family protein [unclassified Bradyrhizobium]MCP1839123.1 hypothetical protein [Bradyrhizobium sp. USDA 4538]MCP1899688.1 hypothetical protein [Bradyrhizobium sp. USDA 4537]MCP1986202.1 hypothetical protein [Bradyrhizobium sp. USDA 4539]